MNPLWQQQGLINGVRAEGAYLVHDSYGDSIHASMINMAMFNPCEPDNADMGEKSKRELSGNHDR